MANGLGLYPDYMHIVHLACATDSISSILLDLVAEPNIASMVAPEIRNWRRYGTTIEVGRSQPETKTQRIFARLGFQTICMLVGAIYIH